MSLSERLNPDEGMSYERLLHRLNLRMMTDDFLFSLTPQQRDELCNLRNLYRRMPKFSAAPLLRACDLEQWVKERW